MDISISGRHVEVTDEIRNYATEKFQKLERFFSGVQSIEVILKNEDRKQHCEAIIHTQHNNSIVIDVARDETMEAIDVAVDKCERQLRRTKEKSVSHRRKAVTPPPEEEENADE